ncbi:MAG: hypothetical protein R3F31_01980 [Verrucomicrobiales bacterium]
MRIPILVGRDKIITVEVRNKEAAQKLERHKPVPEGIEPRDVWTYLHAIDKKTGANRVDRGSGNLRPPTARRMAGQLRMDDGPSRTAGGGHGPLKTYGVSLSLSTRQTLWSREINGDSSYNSHRNANTCSAPGLQPPRIDSTTGETLRTQRCRRKVDISRCTDRQT